MGSNEIFIISPTARFVVFLSRLFIHWCVSDILWIFKRGASVRETEKCENCKTRSSFLARHDRPVFAYVYKLDTKFSARRRIYTIS